MNLELTGAELPNLVILVLVWAVYADVMLGGQRRREIAQSLAGGRQAAPSRNAALLLSSLLGEILWLSGGRRITKFFGVVIYSLFFSLMTVLVVVVSSGKFNLKTLAMAVFIALLFFPFVILIRDYLISVVMRIINWGFGNAYSIIHENAMWRLGRMAVFFMISVFFLYALVVGMFVVPGTLGMGLEEIFVAAVGALEGAPFLVFSHIWLMEALEPGVGLFNRDQLYLGSELGLNAVKLSAYIGPAGAILFVVGHWLVHVNVSRWETTGLVDRVKIIRIAPISVSVCVSLLPLLLLVELRWLGFL